jgi:multicomponent Na+:H+ antiporter subunit F
MAPLLLPSWSLQGAYGAIAFGLLLTTFRLFRGPNLPDRIIALDLKAALVLCLSLVHAMDTGNPHYLDIAVAIAVVTFIGTIAFARFLEKPKEDNLND